MSGGPILFLFLCALMGVATGLKGKSKGSYFWIWFMVGACVPILGFIAALAYPDRSNEPVRQCHKCGRVLPISDTVCMRCGTDLPYPTEIRIPR